MLHSLLTDFKIEFDSCKSLSKVEDFSGLRQLLLDRGRAIEQQDKQALEKTYAELFKEIKKLMSAAVKNYQNYLKKRTELIKKMDIERKTIAGEPLLGDYVNSLERLREDIMNYNAEIDINYFKKLEETLQQEKAGFSQQFLFSFFKTERAQNENDHCNHQLMGAKR